MKVKQKNAKTSPQVALPEKVTRSTAGPHRSPAVVPPGQHLPGTQRARGKGECRMHEAGPMKARAEHLQSLGKACCKLGTSWVLGRDSGVAIVFSSYFLRILFVFSWCFAFVLPRGLLSRRPLISACCNLLTVEPAHCHRRASRAREGRRSAWPRFPSARSFL